MAQLIEEIKTIRQNLESNAFSNEAAVSNGILLPLLQALDWPTNDTRLVYPQFTVEGGRVDFALCHPGRTAKVFIEVKTVDATMKVENHRKAESQLFEYTSSYGVPIALLTDGCRWVFYVPNGHGLRENRKIAEFNIASDSIQECAEILEKYLRYDRVCSGLAAEEAYSEQQSLHPRIESRRALGSAWNSLMVKQESKFVELLCKETEVHCGFVANSQDALEFVRKVQFKENQSSLPKKKRARARKKSVSENVYGGEVCLDSFDSLDPLDTINNFISDCVVGDYKGTVQAKKLYESYCRWCKAYGKSEVSMKKFGGTLTSLEFKKREGRLVYYLGIRLENVPPRERT